MEEIINNLEELEEYRELKHDYVVIFTVDEQIIKYEVRNTFLHRNEFFNNKIFHILKLNKYEIAEKKYGYKVDHGAWPETEPDDYPALTKLVKELYRIIEKKDKIYTKFSRFEIMDI